MRITNSTLLRNYNRNLKRLSTQKYSSENKIYSGRQYLRASQSPLNASKALTVRKQLSHAEQYLENLDVADKFYTEAETSLLQVSDSLASVRETLIYACNSTKEKDTDIVILAEQLETKAKEMVSIFNTDSAERAIFGGEANSSEPFTLEYDASGHVSQVLYHGTPVNAYSDADSFPFSEDIYIDIGIGLVLKDDGTVDSQSGMKISFNGASVSGCGYNMGDELVDFDMSSLQGGDFENTVRFEVNNQTITAKIKGDTVTAVREGIQNAFANAGITDPDKIPVLSDDGELTMPDGSDIKVSQRPSLNLDMLEDGKLYTVDIYASGTKHTISFTAGADTKTTAANVQDALDKAFIYDKHTPTIDDYGNMKLEYVDGKGKTVSDTVYIGTSDSGLSPDYKNGATYSKNYIQVTIDAAAALRRGDIEYANACIDLIVTSSENLLVEIADLGNAEEYIEFNTNRFDTRVLNLQDRQQTLEATNLESEITLYKTYEAIYNACLQMSSSVIPNSIFNYIS